MRSFRAILAAFVGAGAVVAEQSKAPATSPAEIMREMRLQWLTKTPPTASDEKKDEITAAVMDWPIDQTIVTVLASSVGDASIYTTGTFGILGGIGHESVRKAAIAFVECARKHQKLTTPTKGYSYPDRQTVRFFLVAADGVRTVSFSTSQVEKVGTDAYELYSRAQAVLTELRKVTQK